MNISLIKKSLMLSLFIVTSSAAGIYTGATDDAAFNQLLTNLNNESDRLAVKMAQAESLGVNTDYAQVSQVTINLFKDTFAPWDKANFDKVKAMYDAKYFSKFDPVGPKGLPFDELADSIEVAQKAITQLDQQIAGNITLTAPPNFEQGHVALNGAHYEIDGQKIIASKFFWQPNTREINKAYGYVGESYYSLQDLSTPSKINNWRATNFITRINEQNLNFRSPVQFFLGHVISAKNWLRTELPQAFDTGNRLFTDYDIDNPTVKEWLNVLFTQQLSTGIEALGNTEHIHMLANEPTFSIREGGVNSANGVSSYTLGKYTQWLEDKYSTINQLNQTYHTNFTDFSQVKDTYTIPLSLSYQGSAPWYDWNRFNMSRVTDWFKYLHDSVHAVDVNAKTHIKVMGERSIMTPYQDEGMDFEAIAKLVDMPGSDNQSSSLRAEWDLRHEQNWRNLYSLEWRAQAMMLDFNKSVAPDKLFYDSEWHGLSGARWRDFHMSADYVRTIMWSAATHGLGALTTWVWNRKDDGSIDTRADFIGTSVTQPIQLDAYGRTLKELNAHGNIIANLVPKERAYILYYNKDAAIQDPTYTQKLADVYEALKLQDVTVGFTTPSELPTFNKDKQTLIISPTTFISNSDLLALNNLSRSGGSTIVFDSTDNFKKNELGETRTGDTTLLTLASLNFTDVVSMADALKVALVDRKPDTTITVSAVDNQHASVYGVFSSQYNDEVTGHTMLSLINTRQDTVNVNLTTAKGAPTDIRNVITEQPEQHSLTMKPLGVYLLDVDSSKVENTTVDVTGVTLSETTVQLTEGDTKTITAVITPNNASNKALVWSSSNEQVATVDGNGKITAIKAGNVSINATSVSSNLSEKVSLTVVNATQIETPANKKESSASGGVFSTFLITVLLLLVAFKKITIRGKR